METAIDIRKGWAICSFFEVEFDEKTDTCRANKHRLHSRFLRSVHTPALLTSNKSQTTLRCHPADAHFLCNLHLELKCFFLTWMIHPNAVSMLIAW